MKDFNAEGAQARVPERYSVNVYDRAGLYHEAGGCNWQTALILHASLRKQFPDKAVRVFNYDRADERYDGLTDEERDALDDGPAATAAPDPDRRAKDLEAGRDETTLGEEEAYGNEE